MEKNTDLNTDLWFAECVPAASSGNLLEMKITRSPSDHLHQKQYGPHSGYFNKRCGLCWHPIKCENPAAEDLWEPFSSHCLQLSCGPVHSPRQGGCLSENHSKRLLSTARRQIRKQEVRREAKAPFAGRSQGCKRRNHYNDHSSKSQNVSGLGFLLS